MLPSSHEHSSPRPSGWLIAGCLLVVYVIWGTTYFAIKVGIEGTPPFFLVGSRFLVAGGLLVAWQAVHGRPMPTFRQWRGAALLGFLMLVVGNGGVAVAEHWVSSGATVALISIILLGTACWSLGTVLTRRVDIPQGPTGFGAEMLAAGVLALMLSVLLGEHWTLPHSPRVWWAWSYLVVFGSVIAFSAYRFVVERVS